jgi:hypothetical protein
MFLKARPPGGALTEPIQLIRRAIWYGVQQRMHYADIAINNAGLLATVGNKTAAASMFKNYLDLCDPERADAVEDFVEKGKALLRKVNEEGALLKLTFSKAEILSARREEARKNASWYGNRR